MSDAFLAVAADIFSTGTVPVKIWLLYFKLTHGHRPAHGNQHLCFGIRFISDLHDPKIKEDVCPFREVLYSVVIRKEEL